MSAAPSPASDVTAEMLAVCASEPIHIPGAIQPHGALLALRGGDLLVLQASANTAAWIGLAPERLLGQPLGAALPAIEAPLRALLAADALAAPRPLPTPCVAAGREMQIAVHRSGDAIVLEIEELDRPDPGAGDVMATVDRLVAQTAAAGTADALFDAVARGVRAITGYDRVMVYRFDPAGNGEVVAEQVADGVESFLGLRYPASDIPPQARAMFLLARVRVIVDSAHRPVPLVPREDPRAGAPLDLGRCALRAVSPIHLEYLRNMRVGASLTAGVIVGDRLWGLIACHHLTPRDAPHGMRAQVGLVAGLLAARLGELHNSRRLDAQIAADRLQRELLVGFGLDEAVDWTAALMRPERVLALLGASGAALLYRGGTLTAGEVPGGAALSALVAHLRGRAEDLVAEEALPTMLPELAAEAERASGCLAIRLAPGASDLLIWFRPEQVREVTWGGDPAKPVERDPARPQRLTPRTSFAAWRETVRGRCRAWSIEDVAAAEGIRAHLGSVVRHVYEVRQALARSNRELAEFAHAAAHDLQEPLRSIARSCELLGAELSAPGAPPLPRSARELLALLVDGSRRGQALVKDLLDYARLDHEDAQRETVALAEALAEATAALRAALAESGGRIEAGDLPTVHGNRRQIIQLLQNLIGNAITYRAELPPSVRVHAVRRPGAWQLSVADNGIGIDARHHERIFTIFKRLHGKGRYPGNGVGLALCKKIAELHGGRIWVESELGRGSTFHVTIADRGGGDGS